MRKVIDYINELSNNEENYRELRNVEAVFNEDIKRFRVLKRIKLKELEEKYKDRLKTICDNGRHCCDAL